MLLRASATAPALFDLFRQITLICMQVDKIKGHIFYGKELEHDEIVKMRSGINPRELDITGALRFQEFVRHIHGITGIVTETGELIESILAVLSTGKTDIVNFSEELGDLEWYIAECANAIDKPMFQILVDNIAKLKERYSEKFNVEEAVDRDLDAEREALEKSDKASPDPFQPGDPRTDIGS